MSAVCLRRGRCGNLLDGCEAQRGRPRALRLTICEPWPLRCRLGLVGGETGSLTRLRHFSGSQTEGLCWSRRTCASASSYFCDSAGALQPLLRNADRQCCICASRCFAGRRTSLLIVKPDSGLRWHRRHVKQGAMQMSLQDMPPPFALFRMISGFYVSRAIHVMARLGIADFLADGPVHTEELAKHTKTHAPSLRRVLRLLVTAGVVTEDDDGRF